MQFSQTDSTSFCFRQTSTGPMLYGLLCALCTILLISVNCLLATHWLGTNAKSEAARPSLKKVRGLRPDAPPPSESDEYAHLHSSPNRLWRCVHTTGCTTGCKVKIPCQFSPHRRTLFVYRSFSLSLRGLAVGSTFARNIARLEIKKHVSCAIFSRKPSFNEIKPTSAPCYIGHESQSQPQEGQARELWLHAV